MGSTFLLRVGSAFLVGPHCSGTLHSTPQPLISIIHPLTIIAARYPKVRAQHPEARPEEYASVDERWRKFANCQLGEMDGTLRPVQSFWLGLPSMEARPDLSEATELSDVMGGESLLFVYIL